MRLLGAIVGIAVIFIVAQDAFETVVLPRRVDRHLRLTRLFYRTSWHIWRALGRATTRGSRRDAFLSYFGPLSLLALFAMWGILFVFGFATLMWGLAVPLNAGEKLVSFGTYLYFSGTTFFTLGLGDVFPLAGPARALVVGEVALGFGFLALVISYAPIIYQAFSRRELRISLLDARAGSPAAAVEVLRRNHVGKDDAELQRLLHEWEEWCADILESHLSYPVLAYYRSQHEVQSWLEAITVVLDTCSLILTGIEGVSTETARFTFAMARHTAVDLAQVLNVAPGPGPDRLPTEDFARVCETLAGCGVRLSADLAAEQTLAELRATYEPFVCSLAHHLAVSLPPWLPRAGALDDWQTSAWDERLSPSVRQTLSRVVRGPNK